ncbi:SusE domain-containing protein [Pseudotenacibaculum haliotis]|uniref:SusE domain-containing protein n=1 Tax=Pseudotenacibaculum haliotis TaxID=1862138 RepID=A0ABW5LTG8_9FLAO
MKNLKQLSIYAFAALFIVLFSSCDDDSEQFTVTPTAAFSLSDLSINAIELDPINTSNPAATFNWTEADYGQQASVNYSIEVSVEDTFAAPHVITTVTGNTSVTVSINEMNSAAGSIGLAPFQWGTMYVRVKSTLGTQNGLPGYSNTISFDVLPFFNYPFTDYYLVGDGTAPGWNNNSNNPPIFRDGSNSNVYYYTGFFTAGHFKLLEVKGLWQPQWGTNDGSTIEVNDGTGSDPERFPTAGGAGITTPGFYTFTIDFSTNTYTFGPYNASGAANYTSMTLQGSATGSATAMTQSTFDSHLWYLNSVHLTQGNVQFMTNTSSVWGGTTEFSGLATENGGNVPVVVEDDYDVWYNDLTGHYILIPLNL